MFENKDRALIFSIKQQCDTENDRIRKGNYIKETEDHVYMQHFEYEYHNIYSSSMGQQKQHNKTNEQLEQINW